MVISSFLTAVLNCINFSITCLIELLLANFHFSFAKFINISIMARNQPTDSPNSMSSNLVSNGAIRNLSNASIPELLEIAGSTSMIPFL